MKIMQSKEFEINEKLKRIGFRLHRKYFNVNTYYLYKTGWLLEREIGYLEIDRHELNRSESGEFTAKLVERGGFIIDHYKDCEKDAKLIEEATGREVIIRKSI